MPRPCRLLAVSLAVPLLSFVQAQTAVDDPGVTVDAGATLRHRAPVHYPKDSVVAGTVEIEARLNSSGEVADARVVSGPEELRKDSLWSVLQWHYGPNAPAPVHISIRFDSAVVSTPRKPILPLAGTSGDDFLSGVLKTVEFAGLGAEAENELRARLPFQEGDPLRHSDLTKIGDLVREFDDHLATDFTGQIAAPDAHRDLTIHIHPSTPAPPAVLVDSLEELPRPVKR
jgi:hypothetical protein